MRSNVISLARARRLFGRKIEQRALRPAPNHGATVLRLLGRPREAKSAAR